MLAVRAGDENLAREALKRKAEHETQHAEFSKQAQLQKDAVDKLKDQLRGLNDKIEEAKRKKNILIARQKRAEAQKTIQSTMSGLSDTGAFDTFERMAKKVDQIEAEAEAHTELGHELTGDTLQQKFKALEGSSASTDDALAALKVKMGLAPVPEAKAALPEASKDSLARTRRGQGQGRNSTHTQPIGPRHPDSRDQFRRGESRLGRVTRGGPAKECPRRSSSSKTTPSPASRWSV